MNSPFSKDEEIRYSRQTILPNVGIAGQLKLKNARVLFVGAGGLGSAPSLYLAAAGVGTIGLVDADVVSLSNLHRQIVHFTSDLDQPKVDSAAKKLKEINPNITIETHPVRFNAANASTILAKYDLIIDGTDNLPSRYLINDACFFLKKPFVFGGVHRFEGQVSIFGCDGPCYRCIFREPPPQDEMPSCAEAGVFGVLPGIIGLMQANEAIKWICGIGHSLLGRLMIFDALDVRWREVKVKKDPQCPLCGTHPTITTIKEYEWACSSQEQNTREISVMELKALREQHPDLYLLDVREQIEWDIARIDGAHLKPLSTIEENFNDIPKDKSIYCFCKLGGRSRRAINFLKSKGYTQLVNVKGGIQAWSQEVDPTIPSY
jgi:molybdopterin/thiamine biosynthesis adenylyltransferase/rhodanese-related sulfurtransferase